MTNVHLKLDGTWAVCHATQRACPRLFHVQGMSPAEVAALPSAFLDELYEAIDPPSLVLENGTKIWARGNAFHRDYDLPARIRPDGTREWFRYGDRHRGNDKPAILYAGVSPEWWENGKCARASGGPNRIDGMGIQYWFDETGLKLHREGDLPAQIDDEGNLSWHINGNRHRDGGKPAYVGMNGELAWFVHGEFHREDGPAHIHPDGSEEWHWRGKKVEREQVVANVQAQLHALASLRGDASDARVDA